MEERSCCPTDRFPVFSGKERAAHSLSLGTTTRRQDGPQSARRRDIAFLCSSHLLHVDQINLFVKESMLNIRYSAGILPTPEKLPPNEIVAAAQASGNPSAPGALAATLSKLVIDQTGLHYSTRSRLGVEFSFDHGTLDLTLAQRILISDSLSPCASAKWAAHETLHAQDNQALVKSIESALRKSPTFRSLFITPQWFPRDSFAVIQQSIEKVVGDVFRGLVSEAVKTRDTYKEYRSVQRDILKQCSEPYEYQVEKGDNLQIIARHFYGSSASSDRIFEANKPALGRKDIPLRAGSKIVIPRPH